MFIFNGGYGQLFTRLLIGHFAQPWMEADLPRFLINNNTLVGHKKFELHIISVKNWEKLGLASMLPDQKIIKEVLQGAKELKCKEIVSYGYK